MQSIKDSLYIALKERLEDVDPDLTATIKGVFRAGVAVRDAEFNDIEDVPNCYLLHWDEIAVKELQDVPIVALKCSISYFTSGTQSYAGLDSGRLLSHLDAVLIDILSPRSALKKEVSQAQTVDKGSNVFWGEPEFSKTIFGVGKLSRSCSFNVYGFLEGS